MVERKRMPSFGDWDFYDELPVTQFFHSAAVDPEPLHCHLFGKEADLFGVPPSPLFYYYKQPTRTSDKKKGGREFAVAQKQRKNHRPQKAVDEDLYEIPPEFLCRKPKNNRVVLGDFWKRCLGLNCVP